MRAGLAPRRERCSLARGQPERKGLFEYSVLGGARALRILLTGASGFIGSAVSRRLTGAGHVVVGVPRRPRPAEASQEWLALDFMLQT